MRDYNFNMGLGGLFSGWYNFYHTRQVFRDLPFEESWWRDLNLVRLVWVLNRRHNDFSFQTFFIHQGAINPNKAVFILKLLGLPIERHLKQGIANI